MSYYISAFKPDGESFFYFLLFHRFHKKIFYPHPERMKRKIKITAPDNPTFRIQGTEMFCRIQPGHTWQCKKHHCRYCFSYPPKKLFLILIDFNQWKNFLFCTVIPDIFRTVLSFLFLISRSFFADSSIHACLFRSLLLRFVSVPRTFLIFFLHSGQYFDIAEQGTYSTPHTVQFLGFNAVHRFVGVICNSPTKPMNL